jgi:hypothetical protein
MLRGYRSRMGFFERMWDFLSAIFLNWKALLAGAFFVMISLLQLLPPDRRQKFDDLISPELRRKVLAVAAVVFFFVASFLAYDDVNVQLKTERIKSSDTKELRERLAVLERQKRDDTKLYQDGRVVASIERPAMNPTANTISFVGVTADRELDMTKGFEFNGWELACSGEKIGSVNFGAARAITYRNMFCNISGLAR